MEARIIIFSIRRLKEIEREDVVRQKIPFKKWSFCIYTGNA